MSHPILRLTTWQNAVFLLNSRLTHFTAAYLASRHPFSRSYGARLPSSLTRFHSCALVYSTHPPVSVCGTGDSGIQLRAFLGRLPIGSASAEACASATSIGLALLHTASLQRLTLSRCRNINLLCIAYALRPRLSSRLTLGGRTWPRKPWVYGGPGFSPGFIVTRVCILTYLRSTVRLPSSFDALDNALLPLHSSAEPDAIQSFGMMLDRQSFSARDHSMSQLLRTV